nr:MAG TPA: hypothetical protein [Caudoviricetes sp.]DAL38166.1 MAG TPA_asm: hypothetical protein [Bacteriophage sp.]DAK58024.1 MAG TPA: hypothetical protein [Caudoviricetes sp.]DAN21453.1 MAG TPA_asm: hypothetical protein [Bacteriophage sp.]DAU75993.1 MAG TPA: hypothetical protein [Bacteriophage sp.]
MTPIELFSIPKAYIGSVGGIISLTFLYMLLFIWY